MREKQMPAGGEPLEIERKYLIEPPLLFWLESQPGSRRIEIEQTYLLSDGEISRRVRQWSENGHTVYYKNEKQPLTHLTRIEREEQIGEEEYRALLADADPDRHAVVKTRWCIPFSGHTLEIDLYPFWQKQAVLEVELESEDEEICFPEELHILREVSDDRRYLNSSLAGTDLPGLLELEESSFRRQ